MEILSVVDEGLGHSSHVDALVLCGHGERAMTAASLLAARGHEHVSVLAGGPGEWAAATHAELVTGP